MGMAASGNIGDHHAFFEPVHGSAPARWPKQSQPYCKHQFRSNDVDWLARRSKDDDLLNANIHQSVAEHLKDGTSLTADLAVRLHAQTLVHRLQIVLHRISKNSSSVEVEVARLELSNLQTKFL